MRKFTKLCPADKIKAGLFFTMIMEFLNSDQIKLKENMVVHKSAGGVVLFSSGFDLKVALIKKESGEWVLPKGHIRKNENPEEAAHREVREETGICVVNKITKLGVDNYSFYLKSDSRKHFKQVHVYLFIANKKEDIKPLLQENFVEAKWFNIYEALEIINYPSDLEWILRAREYYLLNKKSNEQAINRSVSFCIPVYNGGKVIFKTLNLLKKIITEYPEEFKFEIIVCLDHCTDNTKMVCEDFRTHFLPDLKIISNRKPRAKMTCMNKLVKSTEGDIIVLLDDDIIIDKKSFLRLVDFINCNNDVKIVYPNSAPIMEETKNPIERFWWKVFSFKFREDIYKNEDPYLIGRCVVLRKRDWFNLPENPLAADDIIFQYTYHPYIKRLNQSKIYFHSVRRLRDYLHRFCRISLGRELALNYFSNYKKQKLSVLKREFDYNKIKELPFNKKIYFYCYKFLRSFASIVYKYIKRSKGVRYEWKRIK